jgi:hypothetical protein
MKNVENAHNNKKESTFNTFLKKRAFEYNKLLQSFKNKKLGLVHEQKNFQEMMTKTAKTKLMMTSPGSTKKASKL